MKAYCIFDDFTREALDILVAAGVTVIIHPSGTPRPDAPEMKKILKEYDCVIIGTSQKISSDMFDEINTPRIIATASVGVDHIKVPESKRNLITIINTPKANAQSVAEYTMACALACCKRLNEGRDLYLQEKNNKSLYQKPEDLCGKTIGVIGAGNISAKVMASASFLGMHILCWTRNPGCHNNLKLFGVEFVSLVELVQNSDYISVNLPNKPETEGIISAKLINEMKPNAVFISVSRRETIDVKALFRKAKENKGFYVCLDLDVDHEIVNQIPEQANILITPHIAGGTVETRKRMFREIATELVSIISKQENLEEK